MEKVKNMSDEEFEYGLVKHFGLGGIFGDRKSWEDCFAKMAFGC